MSRNYDEEVSTVLRIISGKKLERGSNFYSKCIEWLGFWPAELPEKKKRELIETICTVFSVDEPTLLIDVSEGVAVPRNGHKPAWDEVLKQEEDRFRSYLPKGGWFEWYDLYTRETEAPLAFHIFCSLAILGASLGRRAWIDQGHWLIYPNYCVILIGPTGRVKKTTAINISRKLLHKAALVNMMPDQMTPEAFVKELMDNGGHQFVCAPEFSILFNKKRYNEGFSTQIIRMLDCPDIFEVSTMGRGKEEVKEPTLTILGGSTLSLLLDSSPSAVISSGFMNRYMLIVENDTHRIFPDARFGGTEIHDKLLKSLKRVATFTGAFSKSPGAQTFWEKWYRDFRFELRNVSDEVTAEMLERLPDHFLRTAMLIHAVQCDTKEVCLDCMRYSEGLTNYIREKIPQLVGTISNTVHTAESDRLLEILRRLGGASGHSDLLRKSRMDAVTFKRHMVTLIEGKRVRDERRGTLQFYVLMEVV